jgi:hypothetical protein
LVGLNKPLPRGRCPCSKKVIQHVDYDQRGRVHGARLQEPSSHRNVAVDGDRPVSSSACRPDGSRVIHRYEEMTAEKYNRPIS